MIDISDAKWDLSKEEKFVINWFDENGYTGKIVKQHISKTIFEVSKDDVTDRFELSQSVTLKNIDRYMEQFRKNWDVLCEVIRLRREIKD